MSLGWTQHLILVPVLLPLVCGALMIPVNEKRHQLKFMANLASVLGLLATAAALIWLTDNRWPDGIGVYLMANWAAPFGIAFLADRLSSLMLLLTALLAGAVLCYSMRSWSRIGVHFHSLFQFLLMGLNGAFLTHDLFNLFVFFEVMLAASYGLLVHGYNPARLRASLHYVAVNLAASLLFLIGVALIYAATGTLNMADLAGRLGHFNGEGLVLAQVGLTILALAFLIKSAMWPLGFWLPAAYAAASPPVAAMFVLLTKVGIYIVLRLWLLVFANGTPGTAGLDALLWGGFATLAFGAVGMLASETPARQAAYAAMVSSGILLALVGLGQSSVVPAALFYLLGSTVAIAAFMLLIELIERMRSPGAAMLAVTMEAFAIDERPEQPVGEGIPATLAFLGLAFIACALIIAGLPPLNGFVAKFSILHALLHPGPDQAVSPGAIALIALILVSGLAAIITFLRFGVRTFWAADVLKPPPLQATEVAPIGLLLLLSVGATVQAGPVFNYLHRTADGLQQPPRYIERVQGELVVPSPLPPGERQ
jgi:multicomponent K+:H+ antiporter subunit D